MKTRTRRLRKKSGGLTGPDPTDQTTTVPTDQTTTVPTGPTGPTVPTGLTGPTTGSTTDTTSPFAAPPVPDKPDNNIPGRPPQLPVSEQPEKAPEEEGFFPKMFSSKPKDASKPDGDGIFGKIKGLFSGGKCKRSKRSKKSKKSKRTKKSKKSKK